MDKEQERKFKESSIGFLEKHSHLVNWHDHLVFAHDVWQSCLDANGIKSTESDTILTNCKREIL
jgi:hypothetical protein